MLCTSAHRPGTSQRRAGRFVAEPIVIGDGVWIGTRAMLLPGVTVADGCVVAAGAVVAQDCEANGLYAGVRDAAGVGAPLAESVRPRPVPLPSAPPPPPGECPHRKPRTVLARSRPS